MSKVNMESLLPFIEEAFNRGLDFQIPITGTSMNPLLYQNRDFVKIVKPVLPLKTGDIPLYRRDNGAFVLHRVVGIKENGEYIMCGDNQFLLEYGITDANIIGMAKTLIIDGKEIDVDTDANYLKHKNKYVKNVGKRYPLRRLRYKLHCIKKHLFAGGSRPTPTISVVGADNVGDGLDRPGNVAIKDIINVGSVLINSIKASINGEAFAFPQDTDFKKLFKLAQNHRITAMVAPSVMKSESADSQIKNLFAKELFKTSARFTAQEKEREELSAELSQKEIKHCFLKGYKVNAFYDNPDSRYMLDMDLYIEKEKYRLAEEILLARGYEKTSNEDDKDAGYIKKPFLIVELHKELKYEYDKGYEYYKGAFERMFCKNGSEMFMTDEDFYVYILSHTAHHFATGGTGIKSVLDHYYLNKNLKPACDASLLKKNLSLLGLEKFAEQMDSLCDNWFGTGESNELTEKTAEYIILSGVFGNEVNSYLGGISRGDYNNDKKSYFISRVLPPLKTMKIRYNVLDKCPALLPVFWCIRIIQALLNPNALTKETKTVLSVDEKQKKDYESFIQKLGL